MLLYIAAIVLAIIAIFLLYRKEQFDYLRTRDAFCAEAVSSQCAPLVAAVRNAPDEVAKLEAYNLATECFREASQQCEQESSNEIQAECVQDLALSYCGDQCRVDSSTGQLIMDSRCQKCFEDPCSNVCIHQSPDEDPSLPTPCNECRTMCTPLSF